jgi:pyruvate kinase-like protein
VLKIETRQAFEQPPQLLLTAMLHPKIGVMIARVDLAVECGYERLAELQEEILWLYEAAHLPIIWATQVREQLIQRGQPSLAEISDAAMSDIRLRVVPLRHVTGIPALVVGPPQQLWELRAEMRGSPTASRSRRVCSHARSVRKANSPSSVGNA